MTLANPARGRTKPLLASAACFAAVFTLVLNRNFYERTANDVFLSVLMASVMIVFVYIRPWREVWLLVAVFVLLVAGQMLVCRVSLSAAPAGAVLGVTTLLLLGLRRIWSVILEERSLLSLGLLPPLLFVILAYFSPSLLDATDRLHPKTLDLYLYAFDGSLGMQPSFVMGRVVLQSWLLTRVCVFCYYALPSALMLVYAQQLVRRGRAALCVFLAFFLASPLGIILYNLFPACGPIYLFPAQFPKEPMTVTQVRELFLQPVALTGARNAFPSLHMAWALLALWYGQGLSAGTRTLLMLFLAGTVLATLGLGEHYFIDLVAAVPFSLMVRAATAEGIPFGDRRRFEILLSGLLWTVAWVGLLRFGMGIMRMTPLIPWTLIVCSTLSCIVWQARLPGFGRDVNVGSP
jgi:hypothetical protein